MFRTVIYNVGMALGLVKMMFSAPKCIRLEKEGRMKEHDDISNRLVENWGKRRVKQAGARINVKGLENIPKDRTVMFVANHQSNFDIPVLLGNIPIHRGFVAKKELEKVPLLGYWMKRIHCLFMDRDDMKQSMQVIVKTCDQLKDGYSMIIFPEGTRSKGGPVKEFKAGSFKPAIKAKVPIIPVTVDGTYRVIEGNKKNHVKPADVNLIFHPLIETADLTKEETKELPAKVRDIITGCMEYTDDPRGENK